MTTSDMDSHRLSPSQRAATRRMALASAASAIALLLSGCDVDRVSALEERVKAVEAKADAAEKRAKAAESLAVSNQPQAVSQPEPVPQTDDPSAGDFSDTSMDDTGDAGAPPPMADNGKG